MVLMIIYWKNANEMLLCQPQIGILQIQFQQKYTLRELPIKPEVLFYHEELP
jgi:hypothetical protein